MAAMKKILVLLLIVSIASAAFAVVKAKGVKKMELLSPAFKNMGNIPVEYTADGKRTNPPLVISNVPAGTKSFALICDDPDAVRGTFDHWACFNISPKTREIKEGSTPAGALSGSNSAGTLGYYPPSPPPGIAHHYTFTVYALDVNLHLKKGTDEKEIEKAMKGHIIAISSLTGLYGRQ